VTLDKQVWRDRSGARWNPRRLILERVGTSARFLQPTAAMIVFGGTLGAVMLQFSLAIILLAVRQLGSVFVNCIEIRKRPFSNSCNTRKRLGARALFAGCGVGGNRGSFSPEISHAGG